MTPEQQAEGWRVQSAGGMWVKAIDISKIRARPSAREELSKLRTSLERLVAEWESRRAGLTLSVSEKRQRETLTQCIDELRELAKVGEP